MSEEEKVGRDLSLEEVPDIAAAYLEASDAEPAQQKRLDFIETEIKKLESERSEVVENAGEDNFLVKEIDIEIQKLKDEREEIQESTEDITQLRLELLRAASKNPGFQLNEHWLNPESLRALTHALYGTEEEKVVVADQELSASEDTEGLDRMQELQIKREIMNIARDRLSDDRRVVKRWEEFEGSSAHQAFRTIVQKPGVGPSEIAEAQDASASTVRNWTSDLSNQEILKMVYTPRQGEYHPSTIGKYYAAHFAEYADTSSTNTAESNEEEFEDGSGAESAEETTEATESAESPEQLDLGNSTESLDNQPDATALTDQSLTSSEADTTEEKAEAMFSNIGEGGETGE